MYVVYWSGSHVGRSRPFKTAEEAESFILSIDWRDDLKRNLCMSYIGNGRDHLLIAPYHGAAR